MLGGMPRLRAKLVTAGLALLAVPVLILLAELVVRLFAPRIDPLSVFVASPQLVADTQGEHTRGMFEFDPLLTWRLRPGLREMWWDYTPVTTNAAHVRMERELGAKRGLRVVCVGDSVTFGYRVPVAHDRSKPGEFEAGERPYPALIESALRAAFPGREIEVVPLACPGYSSKQGLEWLRREIAALDPDMVTACFGWNDVRIAGPADRMTFPTGSAQATLRRFMAGSQLLLHVARSAQQRRAVEFTPEPRSSETEYTGNFMEMARLCSAHGAWFGIILPVYRDPNIPGDYPEGREDVADPGEGARMTRYRAQLAQNAAENNVPFIELAELTERGWPANGGLFGERIHPNAAGHALMAERLLAWLKPVAAARLK